MKLVPSVTIRAPLSKVFLAAADLTRWPEFLPHYRHNRFLSQTPSGGVVKMSCMHAGVPFFWVSQFRIDARRHELRFTHLRSTLGATSGGEIVWTFEERPGGEIEVAIHHHPAPAWPVVGRLMPHKVLGGFLIPRLAEKTLAGLKRKVEAQQHAAKVRRVFAAPAKPARKSRLRRAAASRKPAKPARKAK